tara:strand:- start:1059 stop:1757 length:699 start_codon:yes stop_codon:yes gene_type:complete
MMIFEDVEPNIEKLLIRYRNKWNLDVIRHYEFEDFKQDVKLHIYLKFQKWKQSEPFDPWCSRVIHNQLINKKRNLFTNHSKPCSNCFFNNGGDSCGFTESKIQSVECSKFKQWTKGKKSAYEIKTATDIDSDFLEISKVEDLNIDYEKFLSSIRVEILDRIKNAKYKMTSTTLKIFDMTYLQKKDDNDISRTLGYTTSERNRNPGYRNLSLHRKIIKEIAKELLTKEDYDFV